MGNTRSSRPSGTANRERIEEDDHISEYGSDLDETSGEIRHRARKSEERSRTAPRNGAANGLKRQIPEWSESSDRNDNNYEEGEEYEHLLDPNLPDEETIELHRMDSGSLASFDDETASKAGEENSPYEEVRAAVRNYDEDLPCNTLRAWSIGLALVLVGASMNTLFSLRQPSIGLGALIAQIIAWPLGRAWEKVVPDRQIRIFGLGCDLNPGPFNIKEHSIIVVMASVSFSVAYATDIILAQLVFYKQNFGIIFQLVLTISTQSLGYGIAGMMRKFLVYPASMIWPGNLVAVALMNAMYEKHQAPDPSIIGGPVTNHQIGLNVLTEFVYGYIQPGRPLALMLFKTYGYITMAQALSFVSDLKFGHYMKIPPRTMFMAQVVATTFSCFIQIAVLNFALGNIEGVCELTQPQRFTCPGGRVFFSASVIWGLIGPSRVFSPGQIYSGLLTFFVVGAVAPIIFWFAARRWPRSGAKYLMAPLIFGGAGSIPPATPLNYLSWGVVGFVFQYVIKKTHFRWWSRLNYLTSAGLDLGLALGTLVIFFVFTLNEIEAPRWWGNDVVTGTMDYQGKAIQVVLPPGETFGPEVW
ncbi:Sexual differentiation process protein isp4 [Daldinia childiae]|uniref:Sexual differentiation process protein isp4 n=1 Tax=Daldinia childiae TaxID=326645 RepID=UPI00144743BD|nr:Sexual differentiation process protein isp4 [Daldinia childiae]KAF3059303.1 Sexual differentiation process protein isp4 [Daldinia childiae]